VASRLIRPLSRGFRQRVGLAQALAHSPPVLLLDEPIEGLDPRQIARFRTLISEHARQGAVLLSTHQLDVVAGLCNRLMVLHEGRVVLDHPLSDESSADLHTLFAGVTGSSITPPEAA
jgi:ABC-2 type transport system ATP-binding protein